MDAIAFVRARAPFERVDSRCAAGLSTVASCGPRSTRAQFDAIVPRRPSVLELSVAKSARPATTTSHHDTRANVDAAGNGDDGTIMAHRFVGHGTLLVTSSQAARAIEHGEHQIDVVGGTHIAYPSQDLRDIESADPRMPGQTHVLQRHLGSDLAANVARLRAEPHIRAAGSYRDVDAAQFATDVTIANPANQRFLADFLADASRSKDVLYRVDLGRVVGTNTLRRDLEAGTPRLLPATTADVVVVKDASFPEGYRVLTSYPEATRPPEVDPRGKAL